MAALVLAGVAACSHGPLRVGTVQTGKSLNSDNSVGTHGTRFAPTDTLYVAVLTRGPGTGTLGVRWTFRGRLVYEETKDVSYTSDAATEFHLKYAGSLPTGDYAVEVLVDGKPFVTRALKVQEPAP